MNLVGGVEWSAQPFEGMERKPRVFVIGVLFVFVRGRVDSQLLAPSLVSHWLHQFFNYKMYNYIKVYDENNLKYYVFLTL